MAQKSKSFNVLLKISFFKNELYRVFCDDRKLTFKCLERVNKDFTIHLDEINSVCMYGDPAREIEIKTKDRVIIGNFRSTRTSNRVTFILKDIFKERFIHVHH